MAQLHLVLHDTIATIEAPRARQAEHVLFHPTRGSVISVSNTSLQELDLATGALVGEAEFDLAAVAATVGTSALTAGDRVHTLEHLIAAGSDSVVAVFQSRWVIVWDLQYHVLQSISEVEKLQKGMSALAGSLCRDRWLFYASEGSASVKVTRVDAKDIPKKVSRKAASRSSQITALAYATPSRTLCCGSSDGIVQLWAFAEDNALGGKDEMALATLLFASPATQSPVVQLTAAVNGVAANFVVAAYQSRLLEVWAVLAPVGAKARDPQRVAMTQLSPQLAVDFAKKSGELMLAVHAQRPLVIAHWHPVAVSSSSSAVAWAFQPSIGAGVDAVSSSSGGMLSDACALVSAAARNASSHNSNNKATDADDSSSYCAAGVGWLHDQLVCYRSMHTRSLSKLRVDVLDTATTAGEPTRPSRHEAPPTLATCFTLAFDQYWSYADVPTHVLQVAANPESSAAVGAAAFVLALVSLQTGTTDKLDDLPAWRSAQNRPLVPWTLVANQRQTALFLKLMDRSAPLSTTAIVDDDARSVTYVVIEIKARAGALQPIGEAGSDTGEAASRFRVTCGALLEARDVCFADHRSLPDAAQSYVLVVLATSGCALSLQRQCDVVESARIALPRPALRVFSSPVALPPDSPHATTVGSRVLFVSLGADGRQSLQLSDDELRLPVEPAESGRSSTADATPSWTASSLDEVILDVTWNQPSSASQDASTADAGIEVLAAVRTTERLVILTHRLRQVCAYDLVGDLQSPQSMLWLAQTLLVVTRRNQVRYVTPLAAAGTGAPESRLVCCLAESNSCAAQHMALVAVCGDRLAYATTDARTLEIQTFVRPLAIVEPLAAGFSTPNPKLKAIVERDVLVFAMTGGTEAPSPLTDVLLHVLADRFGWRDTTLRLLAAVTNPSSSGTGGEAASGASPFAKTSHVAPSLLASLFVRAHKWRECLHVFLAHDPALDEYALADDDASSAKLPSRTSRLAMRFRAFGALLDAVGESALALKCLDVAGDDIAIVEIVRRAALTSSSSSTPLVAALEKDWSKLNPPLAALLRAELTAVRPNDDDAVTQQQLASVVWCRHDLFSLLCCDVLQQNERRSRLLASVQPFDKRAVVAVAEPTSSPLDAANVSRARVLPWKRLVPEDVKDWIGVAAAPHVSTDEPKQPTFGYAATSAALGGASSGASGLNGGDVSRAGAESSSTINSGSADASAKMTIGPFVDDEDAVVAYWRFEEGATLSGNSSDDTASRTAVESLDTSKRENNLQLLGFRTATTLVTSTAPVDRGEEGRVQEAFALRFPSPAADSDDLDAKDTDWGATCNVRSGSTLDIGFVYDDDPYRRKLTLELWVRNYALASKREQQLETTQDDDLDANQPWTDSESRLLACRQSKSSSANPERWWAFALVDGHVVLDFAGQSVRSDERVTNAASWHHVAFSIDVLSPTHAAVKLYLQGRCVAATDVSGIDTVNAKLYAAANAAANAANGSSESRVLSSLYLGCGLRAYEMTEVRVWAAARTQDQLSDMKENYLGIAEAKKRMKIAIHQRNCQCDKCHARRTKAPAAKLALPIAAFPSTPPGAVRDRRRPASKQ